MSHFEPLIEEQKSRNRISGRRGRKGKRREKKSGKIEKRQGKIEEKKVEKEDLDSLFFSHFRLIAIDPTSSAVK